MVNLLATALLVVVAIASSLGCTAAVPSRDDIELSPQPAAALITEAFGRFPLVGLSEMHGSAESQAFLGRLIRHPGFAGTVNVLQPPPSVVPSSIAAEFGRRRRLARETAPFRGAQIRFEVSAPTLTLSSEEPLRAVLSELRRDRTLRVLVKAFADMREPNPVQLTAERATVVSDWLAARGVARGRLQPLGCGAVRPLWADDAAEHRAANRRAEIVRVTRTAGCQPPASFDWP